MSENNDYNAGYRGEQFHHGMDRAEYERGKAQKETIENIGRMAAGNRPPLEVPLVAFTLLLIAPMIWMIYPILGLTLWAVAIGYYFLLKALHVALHWGALVGFILCVASFIPGMKLEMIASQLSVYRWFRVLVRIGAPLIFVLVGVSGDTPSEFQFFIKTIEPSAIAAGICIGFIAYLIYQRLDLLYFPAKAKIKKLQDKIQKGERPQRSKFKRIFYGFCWLVPTLMILMIIEGVGIRLFMNAYEGQDLFKQLRPIFAGVNFLIWMLLFLFGKLPGTGKHLFSKQHEEDLQKIKTS